MAGTGTNKEGDEAKKSRPGLSSTCSTCTICYISNLFNNKINYNKKYIFLKN
jgi:hypothetical protein